jgi:3' terminal RNA ribose 2'-O-methyltransferase Hen1
MLFTITTTHTPATDLGYLLMKNPARAQSFDLAFGQAHVFYPEATPDRCTAVLVLDVDPVGLVRGRKGSDQWVFEQYVNDRPYVASSFLSVALAQVYGSALNGKSKDRPDLVNASLPLQATLSAVPCRGGEALLRRLWEPLGYTVHVEQHPLDPQFPDWGMSRVFTLTLQATTRLQDLLEHVYVLVPVLDDEKHYWFGEDEVEKLLRRGEGWLPQHRERDLIVNRYLRRRKRLTRAALERLLVGDANDPDSAEPPHEEEQAAAEERISLHDQRLAAVLAVLRESGARRVLDLGCGEGKLLRLLLADQQFVEIVGMDVAYRALEIAHERLRLDQLPAKQRERITLLHGSLIYRDERLHGYDAAAVVEVIEHLEPARLRAFERVVWEFSKPGTVVVTTPNREYNATWTALPAGTVRHHDHRFEWTRAEFQGWATGVAERFGYTVRFQPVGPEDAELGAPTQMAVFAVAT